MARQVDNAKGFLVLEISQEEAAYLGFGISKGCICMECNNIIEGPILYIAVLNDVMDKECFDKWYKRAHNYPEDRAIEQYNYDYYRDILEQYRLKTTGGHE